MGERTTAALRRAGSITLFVVALLLFLITFLTPREDGGVSSPGFLVLCYVLPVIGMFAAVLLGPNGLRRAWIPATTSASASGGWLLIVLALW